MSKQTTQISCLIFLFCIFNLGCDVFFDSGPQGQSTPLVKAWPDDADPTVDSKQEVQEPTPAPESPSAKAPSAETPPTAKAPPKDVREVGPPENPVAKKPTKETENSSVTLSDLQNRENPVDSPLKQIPLPEEEPEPVYVEKQTMDIPKNWTRITPVGKSEVWVDVKAKQIMVAGVVCMQRGGLEMFICPMNTKEHESVVAVNARSYEVHTALLATGTAPGKPVQWQPEYQAAQGPAIGIEVMWKDPETEEIKSKTAQEMIRHFRTKKPLALDFVFGGSVLEKDTESGQVYYYGDGGELVCVSNFSTATMDLPIESSQSNDDLVYEANPDNIPEPGTKVYVVFKPKPATTPSKPADDQASDSTDDQ